MLPFYTNCSSIGRGIFILSSARCEQARQASSEKHYDIDRRRSSKKYQTQVATSKVQATAPHNCRLGETSSALCGSIGYGLPTGSQASLPSLRLSSRTQPVDGTEVLRRLLTFDHVSGTTSYSYREVSSRQAHLEFAKNPTLLLCPSHPNSWMSESAARFQFCSICGVHILSLVIPRQSSCRH